MLFSNFSIIFCSFVFSSTSLFTSVNVFLANLISFVTCLLAFSSAISTFSNSFSIFSRSNLASLSVTSCFSISAKASSLLLFKISLPTSNFCSLIISLTLSFLFSSKFFTLSFNKLITLTSVITGVSCSSLITLTSLSFLFSVFSTLTTVSFNIFLSFIKSTSFPVLKFSTSTCSFPSATSTLFKALAFSSIVVSFILTFTSLSFPAFNSFKTSALPFTFTFSTFMSTLLLLETFASFKIFASPPISKSDISIFTPIFILLSK